jgi:hypothetical protein
MFENCAVASSLSLAVCLGGSLTTISREMVRSETEFFSDISIVKTFRSLLLCQTVIQCTKMRCLCRH